MKIASFNINGIKARIQALPDWLDEAKPDVVLLQEIKSVDENFPRELFEEKGYNVETHGQKSFNGVAILSKLPLEDVTRGLPGDDVMNRRAGSRPRSWATKPPCASAGSTCPTAIRRRARNTITSWHGWSVCTPAPPSCWPARKPALMAGDYNIIPQDEDAKRPEVWQRRRPCPPGKPCRVSAHRQPGLYRGFPRPRAGAGPLYVLGLSGRGLEPR